MSHFLHRCLYVFLVILLCFHCEEFILWTKPLPFFSILSYEPISCLCLFFPYFILCLCLHLIFTPIHIPSGCLVNIFIFDAVKGILLLFKHTTCPYCHIFNFANLSLSCSSVKSCLIFWCVISFVLFYFFILCGAFTFAACYVLIQNVPKVTVQ